ncbi:MAG: hypothetical protein U0324_41575 [Polyangiales bacterium]
MRPATPPPDAAPAVRLRGDGPPVHAADGPIVELTRRLYDRVLASLPPAEVAGAGAWLRGAPDHHGVRFGWVAQRRRDGTRASVQAFLLRGDRLRYADLGGFVGRLEPDPMGMHPQEFPLRSTGAPGLGTLVAASERVRAAALDGQCALPMVLDGESPAMPGAAARVQADCATTQAALRARVGLSPTVSVSALYPVVDGQRLEVVGTVQWQGADWAVTYASAHRIPAR